MQFCYGDEVLSRHATRHAATCSVGGAIYGRVQIGLHIVDDHVGAVFQHDPDTATLVPATARTVDIAQMHRDPSHVLVRAGQGETQATRGMVA